MKSKVGNCRKRIIKSLNCRCRVLRTKRKKRIRSTSMKKRRSENEGKEENAEKIIESRMRTTMKRRNRKRGEVLEVGEEGDEKEKLKLIELFTCFIKYQAMKWYRRAEVPSTPKLGTRLEVGGQLLSFLAPQDRNIDTHSIDG
jgi:hypothetical protein